VEVAAVALKRHKTMLHGPSTERWIRLRAGHYRLLRDGESVGDVIYEVDVWHIYPFAEIAVYTKDMDEPFGTKREAKVALREVAHSTAKVAFV
jgi:hypothetical protein